MLILSGSEIKKISNFNKKKIYRDLKIYAIIIEKDLRDKLIILGTKKENADFIFTNYYYNTVPNSEKKFLIPDNYHSIIRLEVNGLLINEIFKKK